MYVDILEKVNAIVDENGQTVVGGIQGVIEVRFHFLNADLSDSRADKAITNKSSKL